jgi:periplasmic protein TonB
MSVTQTSSLRPCVFASAILEPPAGHKKKRMLQSVVSLVGHTSVLALLVALPLLITSSLNLRQLNGTFLVAPPPPAPPPAPRPMVARAQPAPPKFTTMAAKISVPTLIPKKVAMTEPEFAPPPAIESSGGVVGGIGSVLGGDGTALPPPPAAAPAKKAPVFISGDMKQPVLVFSPALMYPAIARAARVDGTVVILAIIDEHGNVVEAQAISGPGLLVQAALQSVEKRKYRPTILDGEPTSVKLRVEVNFHLST